MPYTPIRLNIAAQIAGSLAALAGQSICAKEASDIAENALKVAGKLIELSGADEKAIDAAAEDTARTTERARGMMIALADAALPSITASTGLPARPFPQQQPPQARTTKARRKRRE